MTDYFALLDEPHRPWLDADALKAKFLALSAAVHPDRVHGASEKKKAAAHQRYAELNAAYNCLREPKTRLRHLLELEQGAKPKQVQQIPPTTMDLFLEVAEVCRGTDSFLADRAKITSPLLKVQMFDRGQEWTDKLMALQQKLNAQQEEAAALLKVMNAAWEMAPAIGAAGRAASLPLERLEQVYQILSYLARWTSQIQERIVQLSF